MRACFAVGRGSPAVTLLIAYRDDRHRAEQILLEVAQKHTVAKQDMPIEALVAMQTRYFVRDVDVEPAVYWRITDNWLELTVRFLTGVYGVRDLKNQMSREILEALDEAGIGIASATYEITGLPAVRLRSGEG